MEREMKMKRLFLLTVILMTGVVAQAAPKVMTLDEYLAQKKANAEKNGKVFDEAAAKKAFDKKDLDKDGKWSIEEQTPAPKPATEPTK
jgi:hypothetical protein